MTSKVDLPPYDWAPVPLAAACLVVANIAALVLLMVVNILQGAVKDPYGGVAAWALWPLTLVHPVAAVALAGAAGWGLARRTLRATQLAGYRFAAWLGLGAATFGARTWVWIVVPSCVALVVVYALPRLLGYPSRRQPR